MHLDAQHNRHVREADLPVTGDGVDHLQGAEAGVELPGWAGVGVTADLDRAERRLAIEMRPPVGPSERLAGSRRHLSISASRARECRSAFGSPLRGERTETSAAPWTDDDTRGADYAVLSL